MFFSEFSKGVSQGELELQVKKKRKRTSAAVERHPLPLTEVLALLEEHLQGAPRGQLPGEPPAPLQRRSLSPACTGSAIRAALPAGLSSHVPQRDSAELADTKPSQSLSRTAESKGHWEHAAVLRVRPPHRPEVLTDQGAGLHNSVPPTPLPAPQTSTQGRR